MMLWLQLKHAGLPTAAGCPSGPGLERPYVMCLGCQGLREQQVGRMSMLAGLLQELTVHTFSYCCAVLRGPSICCTRIQGSA